MAVFWPLPRFLLLSVFFVVRAKYQGIVFLLTKLYNIYDLKTCWLNGKLQSVIIRWEIPCIFLVANKPSDSRRGELRGLVMSDRFWSCLIVSDRFVAFTTCQPRFKNSVQNLRFHRQRFVKPVLFSNFKCTKCRNDIKTSVLVLFCWK